MVKDVYISDRLARVLAIRGRLERRNLLLNIGDGIFASLAFIIASPMLVIPAFLSKAGASDTLIGALSAIIPLSTFFVPLLIAGYISKLRFKKPYVLGMGGIQRLHFLTIPLLAILFLPDKLTFFLILYAASALVNNLAWQLSGPAWTDLVAKVTPIKRRGFLFGWRDGIGALCAIPLYWVVKWMLTQHHFPRNYALLFLMAGILFALSLIFIAFLHERKKRTDTAALRAGESLRAIPQILRRDKNYLRFILAQGLISFAAGSANMFLILTAVTRFQIPADRLLPNYLMVSYAARFIGSFIFGWLGDRFGRKRNLLISAPLYITAYLIALFARTPLQYGWVYVFSSLGTAAIWSSILLIVMEFGGETQRPRYMAIYTTLFFPLMMLGPLAGGFFRDFLGTAPNFYIAIALIFIGWILLLTRVKDPRKRATALAEDPVLTKAAIRASRARLGQRP